MSTRRAVHRKLFRAVVVMGAAIGSSACTEHGKRPSGDAQVADTSGPPKDTVIADAAVDTILIL